MSGRRGGTLTVRCPEDACPERAFYEYSSNADYARLIKDLQRYPWKCTRHRHPEQVLTPRNLTRTVILTAERSKRFPELEKLFWREEGAEDVGSGFTFGSGFSAHADDFPEGARLVISVTAEMGPTS